MKQIGFAIMTFAVYTAIINWKVALLLTVGVGFHEYSHLWAAKRLGLATKGFYLVPFMGGVAFITDRYKRYSQQAFVVIMGPVGGGLLALVTAGAWYLTGLPFLAAAASWMCFLNLFNLLPLSFMDGGQLMDTICYSVNRTFGMVLHIISTVVAGFVLWHFNPVIAGIVIFMGGGSVIAEVREWKNYKDPNKRWLCSDAYLNPPAPLSKKEIALTATSWLVTLVILGCVRYYLSGFEEARLSSIIK
jgi:putative peptide zinc metalloprotease protein